MHDASSDEKNTSRLAAMIALAVVVICIAVQQWGASSNAAVGEGEYGKRAEGLLAEGRIDDCVEYTRSVLYLHPEERRAHYYLARAFNAEQRSEFALQELVLAATPVPEHTTLLLPSPTPEQVLALTRELATKDAESQMSNWEQLRLARLAAYRGDWPEFNTRLAAGIQSQPISRTIECIGPLKKVLFVGLGIPSEHLSLANPVDEIANKLASISGCALAKREFTDSGQSCGFAAMAATSYSGGMHLLAGKSRVDGIGAGDEWVFMTKKDSSGGGKPVDDYADMGSAGDLTEKLRACRDRCRDGDVLFGFASDSALTRTSPEGRNALHAVFGLKKIPKETVLCSYVFAYMPTSPQSVVVEAPAVAPDVPALLLIEKGRP